MDARRSKSNGSSNNGSWITFILVSITLILLLVLGLLIYFGVVNVQETSSGIQLLVESIDAKVPYQYVLPDSMPLDCHRRVVTVFGNASVIHTYDKPDGSACDDVCFNSSLPETCVHGECTGTCLGTCSSPTIVGADPSCPPVYVTNALALAANASQALYFQQCQHGLCVYYIVFNVSLAAEMTDGVVSATTGNADGMVTDAQRHCMQFIGSQTPYKSCLVPALASLDNYNMNASITNLTNSSGGWGLCRYSFGCAQPLNAGDDTNSTLTFSFTAPSLTMNVGNAVLARLYRYVQSTVIPAAVASRSMTVKSLRQSTLIGAPPRNL